MSNKKRCFVTGATGMLGSHVVSELFRRGYTSIGFSYKSNSSIEKLHDRLRRDGFSDVIGSLQPFYSELDDISSLTKYFSNYDVIVNCAAKVALSGCDEQYLLRDNIDITYRVATAAKAADINLIHISSIASLGETETDSESIDEECEIKTLKNKGAYSLSKFYSESEVWKLMSSGLRAVILNPAVIIGSGDWQHGSPAIFRLMSKQIRFYPSGSTGFVGVRDVARSVCTVIDKDIYNERFIVCSDNMTYREFMNICADALKIRRPNILLPNIVIKFIEMILYCLGRSTSLLRTLRTSSSYNGIKICNILGFQYSSVTTQITESAHEYQKFKGKVK